VREAGREGRREGGRNEGLGLGLGLVRKTWESDDMLFQWDRRYNIKKIDFSG